MNQLRTLTALVADVIVLGCTEILPTFDVKRSCVPVVNATQVLARAADVLKKDLDAGESAMRQGSTRFERGRSCFDRSLFRSPARP